VVFFHIFASFTLLAYAYFLLKSLYQTYTFK
jgi:hypothetical protein